MDVGVREPLEEVPEVEVGEDRVARAPSEQDRHVERARTPVGDPVQRAASRVVVLERDVGDEVGDRAAAGRRWRRARRSASRTAFGSAAGQRGRGAHEGRRRVADRCAEPGVRAMRIRPGAAAPAGWCTAVLVEHDAGELVAVRQRPAERDRAAPVVGDGDHGPVDAEGVGEPAEVVDPLGGPRASPIRSDQPMPSWSTATTRQPAGGVGEKRPPQVGPGGVAVDAQQGPGCIRLGPLSSTWNARRHAVGVDDVDGRDQAGSRPGRPDAAARPGRRDAGGHGGPRSPDDLEGSRR